MAVVRETAFSRGDPGLATPRGLPDDGTGPWTRRPGKARPDPGYGPPPCHPATVRRPVPRAGRGVCRRRAATRVRSQGGCQVLVMAVMARMMVAETWAGLASAATQNRTSQ